MPRIIPEIQIIAFQLEKPVKKFNWRKLRNDIHDISHDSAIKERLMNGQKQKFSFQDYFRPNFMDWEK